MMPKILLVIAATLSLAVTSCSTTQTGGSVKPADLIAPVVSIAATTVLEKAKTDEDRQAKALVLLKVSEAILAVTDETATGSDLVALVSGFAPDKPHWRLLAVTLGSMLDQYKISLGDEQRVATLRAIAAGLKSTAELYINQ